MLHDLGRDALTALLRLAAAFPSSAFTRLELLGADACPYRLRRVLSSSFWTHPSAAVKVDQVVAIDTVSATSVTRTRERSSDRERASGRRVTRDRVAIA